MNSHNEMTTILNGFIATDDLNGRLIESNMKHFYTSHKDMVAVPGDWLDYDYLYRKAYQLGLADYLDYEIFVPNKEFNKYFGCAAQALADYINTSRESVLEQMCSVFINVGFMGIEFNSDGSTTLVSNNPDVSEYIKKEIDTVIRVLPEMRKRAGRD